MQYLFMDFFFTASCQLHASNDLTKCQVCLSCQLLFHFLSNLLVLQSSLAVNSSSCPPAHLIPLLSPNFHRLLSLPPFAPLILSFRTSGCFALTVKCHSRFALQCSPQQLTQKCGLPSVSILLPGKAISPLCSPISLTSLLLISFFHFHAVFVKISI